MALKSNHLDTNAAGWDGPGGPQDLFFSQDDEFHYPRIVSTDDIYLFEENGNRLIDISSGPVASNVGHNNARVIKAIQDQAAKLPFVTNRTGRTNENIELAGKVAALSGEGYERSFYCSGGSEAIETAIQFVRQWAWANGEKERTKLFSLMPSYHGGTVAALALSGDEAVEPIYKDMAVMPERIPAPLSYRPPEGLTHEQNEDRIITLFEARVNELGSEKCLAIFLEPVGGLATGCNVLSQRFVKGVREVCDRHGMMMVFDEVMSGAGRTGAFLTANFHPDGKPDLVVLAKGIGSGYIPLGIMLAPASKVDRLRELTGFNYGHTSNTNPLACAVGIATLMELEERSLIENARDTGAYMKERLWALAENCPVIGDVRGLGFLLAPEIVSDKERKTTFSADVKAPDSLRQLGFDFGLSIYARRTNNGRFGDWIMTSPPLITTRDQVDEMMEALEKTFQAFVDRLIIDGHSIG
jgi:adenosylmethionine-8-amino-7-oxononanoate aminotransferase